MHANLNLLSTPTDTIYTERYMGLPSLTDNYGAYNRSDVTHYIENFRTKKYFLVHGNADDNVHYQQSMVLSRALEKADILFRQQVKLVIFIFPRYT
jgi:dipeptidyl-peptidase-4